MPVSHSHEFVFIHIPKCAGTSVLAALRTFCAVERATPFDLGFVDEHGLGLSARFHLTQKHLGASDQRRLLGEEAFARYFKFAFVRNPYDRLFSYYKYLKRRDKPEYHKDQVRLVREARDFGDFVRRALDDESPSVELLFDQTLYLTDETGALLVDGIYKYETLQADFAALCRRVGVRAGLKSRAKDALGIPRVAIPALNVGGSRPDFRAAYDAALRDLVEPRFSNDLSLLRYHFDDPAGDREPAVDPGTTRRPARSAAGAVGTGAGAGTGGSNP